MKTVLLIIFVTVTTTTVAAATTTSLSAESSSMTPGVTGTVAETAPVTDASTTKPNASDQCGNPAIPPVGISAYIVGGIEAKPNSWPWQCRLNTRKTDGVYMCGASVLNSTFVMTAAHCVFDKISSIFVPASSITVYCGDHVQNVIETNEQVKNVSRVVPHESFDSSTLDCDIALLELTSPLTLNDYVQPICLPTSDLPAGTNCVVTGWGDTQNGGPVSDVLLQVVLPIVSQTQCQSVHSGFTDNMLCAGFTEGGKDSCGGDSGGPFVCNVDGTWYQHGIVSYGPDEGCAVPNLPGVYARVTAFHNWINGIDVSASAPATFYRLNAPFCWSAVQLCFTTLAAFTFRSL